MRGLAGALVLACVVAGPARAQGSEVSAAPIGRRTLLEQVVLPGSELVAVGSRKSPVVVRITAVRPHGAHFRYDIEWTGLEPGRFDLRDCLARLDRSPTADLPPLPVEVIGSTSPGMLEPGLLAPVAPPRLSGYQTLGIALAALWLAGLVLILFAGRRRALRAEPPPPPPTVADRLRPLVARVTAGAADTAAQAELERLLVAFWRERLGLHQAKAAAAIAAVRAHPEAGRLLRQVELWLHAPEPRAPVDVAALLEPYRVAHLAADSEFAEVR